MAETEYRSKETLPELAKKTLGRDFRVSYVFADEKDPNNLPGIEVLNEADVALLAIHRCALPKAQLQVVRDFLKAGKPLAALRTTSHAFAAEPSDAEHAAWPEFDREILGCHYQGHHGNKGEEAPKTFVWAVPDLASGTLLRGIPAGEFRVPSWLYKSQPLADGATPLLMGRVEERRPQEPVAWTAHATRRRPRVLHLTRQSRGPAVASRSPSGAQRTVLGRRSGCAEECDVRRQHDRQLASNASDFLPAAEIAK